MTIDRYRAFGDQMLALTTTADDPCKLEQVAKADVVGPELELAGFH